MAKVDEPNAIEEMVLRSMAGDTRAFTALVQHFHKRLHYYVLRMIHDHDKAEDVLQNVWLEVFSSLTRLKSTKAFTVWLYRIARSHTINEIRVTKKEITWESLENVREEKLVVEDQNLTQEFMDLAQKCLDRLSPEHREVILLRYAEDLSYQEIAEVTGCGIGTIRSRIHYAKDALSKIMKAADHESI